MIEHVERIQYKDKEILLIGGAHVSPASVALVKEVIETERPDSVCIELNAKRYENMQNPKAWEDTDIVKVIRQKRVGYLLITQALAAYQRKMAKKLSAQVGGEMIQGIRSAKEIGAEIVLCDRDIQTTFLRIWRSLSLWEKTKLLANLILPGDGEVEGDDALQALMEGDVLESMLTDIRKAFPKIGEILISERDAHLALKIREAPGKKVVAILHIIRNLF